MHYPVMTEKHLADRWQVSLKTLRRWRLDGDGPVWHKLFRQGALPRGRQGGVLPRIERLLKVRDTGVLASCEALRTGAKSGG
ncbi:MAG: hypothetical protein Q7T22_02975 [Serpentinimonas sp.]|nr:hypothetical protein [Serpentinimonas sp.]